MADAARTREKMTVEEFFEWQRWQDDLFELVDGSPVATWKAMTGATRRYDRVTRNIISNLHARLRGRPCEVFTDDQSVLTDRGTRRPDIIVDCQDGPDDAMVAVEPRIVIEVLSPSNASSDFILKMDEYRRNRSIHVILVVETRIREVAVWRRSGDDWAVEVLRGDDLAIGLPEIDAELPFAEIYEGMSFPST